MQDTNFETYTKLLEEKRHHLKKLYPLEISNNWVSEADKDGIAIHSIYDDKTGIKIIRAQGLVRAPVDVIVKIGKEIEVGTEWDKSIESVKALYRSDEFQIMHAVVKKVPFIDQRETVLLGKFHFEEDGTVLMTATSVDHPGVDSKDRIRANAHLVGWVLQPNVSNPAETTFTLVLHVDPQGWFPKSCFNWFAHTQGFNIKCLGDYAETLYKKENGGRQ